jgi:hypothetical protein
MKKILLTIFFAGLSSAFLLGQSLSLSWEEVEIGNGDSIYVYGEIPEGFYELLSHAIVTNVSDRKVDVMVLRNEIYAVPGTTNYLCWFVCLSPETNLSPEPIELEAGASTEDWEFAGHYQPNGHNGTSIIEYVFFNADNEEDFVAMKVFFVVSPASLADLRSRLVFGNAYPNPARNQVNFDYELPSGIQSASIQIFNMLGKRVSEMQINPSMRNVSIPVHDLGEGLYFYSLVINGETSMTRKLVIQR